MRLKKHRTKAERESDFNKLADLYVKGLTQVEIAKEIGISQGQVSSDLKKLLKSWKEDRSDKIDIYRNEQLHKLNVMEREMWEAYEKSKSHVKTHTSKSKSGEFTGSSGSVFSTTTTPPNAQDRYWRLSTDEEHPGAGGDMQYWQGIQWCVQERNKILGLYVTKVAQTTPDGKKESGGVKKEFIELIDKIAEKMEGGNSAKQLESSDYIDGEIIDDREYDPDEVPAIAKLLKGKTDTSK